MLGCLRKALALMLLALVGVALWLWGPALWRRYATGEAEAPAALRPSPELAEATLDRLESFRTGTGGDELRLGGAEISSLLRYALPGILPPGVNDPTVRMSDGHLHLSARVAVEAFPELPALGEVLGILPDTVSVEIRGSLTPFDVSRAALHVDRIEAAHIPLPARMIPDVLNALGRKEILNLPPDAMAIPLPQGLSAAYVLRDSLVLVGER